MRPIYLDTGTVAQAPSRDKPRLAALAGYAGLELWHHDIDASSLSPVARAILRERYGVDALQTTRTDLERLKAECAGRGLVIDGAIPPLDFAFRWHADLGSDMRALIQAELPKYHALGVRYIVLPVLSETGSLEQTAEILADLGELMRPFGIVAALEPIGHIRKASRMDQACRVIERAGQGANVGLIVDVFHFFQAQNTLSDLRAVPTDRIVTVHLNDAMDLPLRELSGSRHRVHPGEGIFDVIGFCRTLDGIGYRGPCAVEVLNEDYRRQDAERIAKRSFEASSSVLAAAAPIPSHERPESP